MTPEVTTASHRLTRNLWYTLKAALFPLKCLVCGQFYLATRSEFKCTEDHTTANTCGKESSSMLRFEDLMASYVCPACSDRFTPIESPCCIRCGFMFTSRKGEDHFCGECVDAKLNFEMARAVGIYDQTLMAVIHGFKYGQRTGLARPLSMMLMDAYIRFWHHRPMDIVAPVPLSPKRFRERGFNQAYLSVLSWEKQDWPTMPPRPPRVEKELLIRHRSTPPQTGLGRRERRRNVKGAFNSNRSVDISGQRILLVDDVYTTGATVNECAGILKKAGAETVDVLTLARAM